MKKEEAEKRVRMFIADKIEVELCTDPPIGAYNFNPSDSFLFVFRLPGNLYTGAADYIAVSKVSGTCTDLGRCGE